MKNKLAAGQFKNFTPLQITYGGAQDSNSGAQDSGFKNSALCFTLSLPLGVSARKLAAILFGSFISLPFAKMHQSRRNHRQLQLNNHQHHHHHHRHHLFEDNSDPLPHDLGSADSLRRHVAASLMQHHRAIQRTHNAVRAVSPETYGSSSMEVAPYNPAITPTSSIEFRVGNGETSYSLKTSTELLKVLNRIWSLEEQHAANITLVKALKRELDLARSKIKELARDRQSDRHEMEQLMKQITEDKQGQANATIQSMRDELEGERKLRKRSETLHRKLARELYETKATLANVVKDLEKERKSRVLLEDLCDEFAWGIKNYEKELHSLKHVDFDRSKDSNNSFTRDGMILHISESWLDQRMQMKQEKTLKTKSLVEQLSFEIEAFLEAKRKSMQNVGSVVGPTARRRHSIGDENNNDNDNNNDGARSTDGGDSPCFELNKPVADCKGDIVNSATKPDQGKKKHACDSSSLHVKLEEKVAHAILGEEQVKTEENHTKITEDEVGLNVKYLDSLLKNSYLLAKNDCDDSNNKTVSVRGWSTMALPVEDLESSSKDETESKEHTTLKSKLLEARTRGRRLGSRTKK